MTITIHKGPDIGRSLSLTIDDRELMRINTLSVSFIAGVPDHLSIDFIIDDTAIPSSPAKPGEVARASATEGVPPLVTNKTEPTP